MNTRFRPTPYRDMHLGHAWTALHNWEAAAASGGRFVLIADDYAYNLQFLQERSWSLTECVDRYCRDLEWLGMEPDEVVYSTRNCEAHAEAAAVFGLKPPGRVADLSMVVTTIRNAAHGQADGYEPFLIACRVMDDALLGVDLFYRGADLIGERQLYDFMARQLRLNPPAQEYLPVIQRENAPGKESKSLGAVSIRQLREAGYAAGDILNTLRECDRRSREAGHAATIIPVGVLDVPEVTTLPWQHSRLASKYESEGYADEPFFGAVQEWRGRLKERILKAGKQRGQ